MSFKVKSPKPAPAPEMPAPVVAPVSQPTDARARRLRTGGRQSTFLGGAASSALAAPRGSLTGAAGSTGI
jgi:hypothetical protein